MDEIRCSIELRADGTLSSPGRLTGTLLRFGEKASDRAELFEPDSLEWPDEGVVLRRMHNRGEPIARVTPEIRDGAVVVDVALPDTSAGRSAAVEVRSGLLTGLSVEFRARRQRYAGGVRRIADALLTGAGLVDSPSYKGSAVEVRQRGGEVRRGLGRRLWL